MEYLKPLLIEIQLFPAWDITNKNANKIKGKLSLLSQYIIVWDSKEKKVFFLLFIFTFMGKKLFSEKRVQVNENIFNLKQKG